MTRVNLTDDELTDLTGYTRHTERVAWLVAHGWVYSVNGKGRIVVGRWYADHRLAGIIPGDPAAVGGVDLSAVR